MRLTAASIIAPEKLRDYVLSPTHPDGRAKAAYLGRLGYTQSGWRQLEADLRAHVLSREAVPIAASEFGQKYEILGPLTGPNGGVAWIRTIWIIRAGSDVPRFVTLVPVEKR